MQKEELKFENSTILEGMTSISSLIEAKELKINDRKIYRIYYDVERKEKLDRKISYLRRKSVEIGFEIIETDADFINSRCIGNSHGGIIAECSLRTIPSILGSDTVKNGFYVMIQGVEDPYNFGYALRSLYACGCDGVILPERNWMGAAGVVARSSAGASELMSVFISEAGECADYFSAKGYKIVAADERGEKFLHDADLCRPILLIIGGEKRGISRALLEKCNEFVKINYGRRFDASLSAASAATILGYEVMIKNL
ncbi:MAG: RNA methyltransferase [Eubacteriales bacterium]|nr:RNA methyltransferase [Eubacteriales bacterium]